MMTKTLRTAVVATFIAGGAIAGGAYGAAEAHKATKAAYEIVVKAAEAAVEVCQAADPAPLACWAAYIEAPTD